MLHAEALEPRVCLNDVYEFSPYCKETPLLTIAKDQFVNAVQGSAQ
jgi:hypothetical protein